MTEAVEVEQRVQQLLNDWNAGDIDNAWDVIGELAEIDDKLAKDSKLRGDFDEMFEAMQEICRENS